MPWCKREGRGDDGDDHLAGFALLFFFIEHFLLLSLKSSAAFVPLKELLCPELVTLSSDFISLHSAYSISLWQKLVYFREDADARFADDILRPYGYEGMGSPAGSVGCCSTLGEQESLDFLDSLGPKFKTLADVCTSKSQRGGHWNGCRWK